MTQKRRNETEERRLVRRALKDWGWQVQEHQEQQQQPNSAGWPPSFQLADHQQDTAASQSDTQKLLGRPTPRGAYAAVRGALIAG